MKKQLIIGYLAIAFLLSILMWLFGEDSYRGYAYNTGKAIVWPISIFKSTPEINGDSALKFASSYQKVLASGSKEGSIAFHETVSLYAYLSYIESEPSIKLQDFNELISQGRGASKFFETLFSDIAIRTKLGEHLDGMSFGDILSERDYIEEEIIELLEDRN